MASVTLLMSAIGSIAVDQLSKALIVSRLHHQTVSYGWVSFRAAFNTRAHRGALSSRTAWLTLWLVEVALIVALVEWSPFARDVGTRVALGVALGGATSNLIDVLRRGAVIDFIDLRFWPIFNIADIAIVCGALLAMVSMR